MPKFLGQNAQEFKIKGPGTFTFSAVRPDTLTETEYTLVTVVLDTSGSVMNFADPLKEALKAAINGCKKAPKPDNILVRVLLFNTDITELHGFKPLSTIDPDNDYQDLSPYGGTALYDAAYSAIGATVDYGEVLADQDYTVNGIIFIITDGEDNSSSATPKMIADKVEACLKGEKIESMTSILVAVNSSGMSASCLQHFQNEAKITAFIDIGDASPGKLAKLGTFVSKSVSSTSQALGSGSAPVQSLVI